MAKNKDGTDLNPGSDQGSQAEKKTPSYQLLVNPSGQMIAFNLDDPRYEYYLNMQRPPGVKPAQWYREPTEAELTEYVKAHPYR